MAVMCINRSHYSPDLTRSCCNGTIRFHPTTDRNRSALETKSRDRVAACHDAVKQSGVSGATGWQVAHAVFGTRLDASSQRFAVTETLAHLEYSRLRGQLEVRTDDAAVQRYLPASR